MIIVMKPRSPEAAVEAVIDRLVRAGCDVHRSTGSERVILGVIGVTVEMDLSDYEILPGVDHVVRVSTPYELVDRSFRPEGSRIRIGDDEVGGDRLLIVAGPGAVESEEQIHAAAAAVAAAGASVLRAAAFATRSRPYAFHGLGGQGIEWLCDAAREHGLRVATEVGAPDHVGVVADRVDLIVVGSRHMQNSALLKEVGMADRPVVLKRAPSASVDDWLMAAEYVAACGNPNILLCESGLRTFETATRFTMDLASISVLRERTHLPVLADPSDGTGHRDQVAPMARASVAAGADGLIVEVHPNADEARSDAAQTLYPDAFQRLMDQLRIIAPAVGRSI